MRKNLEIILFDTEFKLKNENKRSWVTVFPLLINPQSAY